MMRNNLIQRMLSALVAITSTMSATVFGDSLPDAGETYISTFFSAVGVSFQSGSTNTPPWLLPETISFRGESWSVRTNETDSGTEPFLFTVSSTNGATNLNVQIDFLPSENMAQSALASVINIPCNFPAAMLAASFSVEHLDENVFVLNGPRPASSGNYCFVTCRNCILSFPETFNFGMDFALALLRAGGVDIPEEPLRSAPPPDLPVSEPFQVVRASSSNLSEAPVPAVLALDQNKADAKETVSRQVPGESFAPALVAVAPTGVFAEAPDNPLFLPDVVIPEDPLVCSAGLRDALSDCHDKIGSVRGYLKTGCKLSNEDAFLALKYFIDDLAGSKSFRDKDDRFQAICCIRDYPCEGSYVFLEHLLADEMEPERRTAAYVLTRMSLGDNARLVRLQAMADTMPTDNWERQEVYQTISNHLQYGSPSHSNQVSLVRFLLNRSLSESKLFDMLDAILCREVPKWRASPQRAENAAKMVREHPDDARLVAFFETVRTNALQSAGVAFAGGSGAPAGASRGSETGPNAESDPWAGLLDDLPAKTPWVPTADGNPLARDAAEDAPPSSPPASSPAPKPIQAMRVFSSDSEAEDEPASPTP